MAQNKPKSSQSSSKELAAMKDKVVATELNKILVEIITATIIAKAIRKQELADVINLVLTGIVAAVIIAITATM